MKLKYYNTNLALYLIKLVGACIAFMSIIGMMIIHSTQLNSFSHMFLVYPQYSAWVLMIVGITLIWYKLIIGIAVIGLAIFTDGFVHNYIMSPLIVLLILLHYIQSKHYYWILPQVILGVIQGIIYVWFNNPSNQYFYLTEGFGLLIGGVFFAINGTNHNQRHKQISTSTIVV